jgi:hypothetical protein
MTFRKLGRPLPSMHRRRNPMAARAYPYKGKKMEAWGPLPSDDERLEKMAVQDTGTLPERLVEKWLIHRQYPYQKQLSLLGGNLRVGGGVVDFLVSYGPPPGVAVRVQGDYWHTLTPRIAKDRIQYQRLIAKGYIVLDLWEGELYTAALGGYLYGFCDKELQEAV